MPDIYMDVDLAVIVPMNILPIVQSADGITIEQALVYNFAGIAVQWNFVTCVGVMTTVAITPTTAGVYDISEPLANVGMYGIEIPASGGASANNDTEGFGWITGKATGLMVWRGPVIGFRRAALNDLFIEGGTPSTNMEDFFDGTGYAGGTAKLNVNVAAQDNIDFGALQKTSLNAATPASVQNIPATGTGLTAIPWNAAWDAEVQSEAQDAITASALATAANLAIVDGIVDDILVDTAVIGALGAGLTALSTQASVDAIKADTGLIKLLI